VHILNVHLPQKDLEFSPPESSGEVSDCAFSCRMVPRFLRQRPGMTGEEKSKLKLYVRSKQGRKERTRNRETKDRAIESMHSSIELQNI
jgi:hypothetical protein